MNDELLKVEKVIRIYDAVCGSCGGHLHYYRISIESIEAQGTHWYLREEGEFEKNSIRTSCPLCGSIFETLGYMIPVECAPFSCPKCGQLQHLEYKIQRIKVEDGAFQFEAKITCRKCESTKSFKEVIKKILGVLKITVGPTGVTVSKN